MSDPIDRQAAIDKINERQRKLIYCLGFENDLVKIMDIAKSIITAMPSVQPKRKKGEWIQVVKHHKDDEQEYDYIEITCSVCGVKRRIGWTGANYCPNCGADMRGEEHDND